MLPLMEDRQDKTASFATLLMNIKIVKYCMEVVQPLSIIFIPAQFRKPFV